MTNLFDSTTEEQTTVDADLQSADTMENVSDNSDDAVVEDAENNETVEQESETDQPSETGLKSVSLKLDDSEYNLELPEAIADKVKSGIMMQADYTRGKQELSEEKKAIAAKNAEIDNALKDVRSVLELDKASLESDEMKELKEYDRDEYYKRVDELDARINTYNEHLSKRNQQLQEEKNQIIQKEMASYSDSIPEWLDEKTQSDEMKLIGELLEREGITRDEIESSLYPAKIMKILRMGALYDKAKKSAESKKNNVPPKSSAARSTNDKPAENLSLYDVLKAQQK